MKTVLLHIGMYKTGTTAIQNALAGYDDGDTHYAPFHHPNHSQPLKSMFVKPERVRKAARKRGLSDSDVDTHRAESRHILGNALRRQNRRRIILSAEAVSNFANAEKTTLLRYLQKGDREVQVLCFLRDPRRYAVSMLSQRLKGGQATVQRYAPRYRRCVAAFHRQLPADALIVKDYTESARQHGDIVRAFAALADLPPHALTPVAANPSLSAPAARMLYVLNGAPVASFGTKHRHRARKLVRDILAMAFPADAYPKLEPGLADAMLDVPQADLDYIAERFDIHYSHSAQTGQDLDPHRYLSDVARHDLEQLQHCVARLGIDLRPAPQPQEYIANLFDAIHAAVQDGRDFPQIANSDDDRPRQRILAD